MRKNRNIRHHSEPDRRYGSLTVTKLINYIMVDGKKSVAETIVYSALERAGKELEMEPIKVLEEALNNTSPVLEVRSRRVGGATYQVPREVRPERRMQLSLRWIVAGARSHKKRHSMAEALAEELVLAAKGEGEAVKKKDNMHRMAEANRAFAHFAW
jgi:small subunit ribosomal protein S7